MAALWTLKGEAAKAMNADERTFEDIGAFSPRMTWRTLSASVLTFSIKLRGLKITTEIIPQKTQQVTLYRAGVKYFTGTVTGRKKRNYQVDITISSVLWALEKLPLTSIQTDAIAATADRLTFVFPTQSITTSLGSLMDRAIALGAPFTKGTLAATFNCGRITLNQMTCGQAIADLIRLTPDVMLWEDHSTALPTLNTARRSTATVRTIVVGTGVMPVEIALESQEEMKVEFVRIPYMTRGVTGVPEFREQLSGDAGTAQVGSTATTMKLRAGASKFDQAYRNLTVNIISGTGAGQTRTITNYVGATKVATVGVAWVTQPNATSVYKIGTGLPSGANTTHTYVVSGKEVDTFLPIDEYDSYFLKTTTDPGVILNNLDSEVAAARKLVPAVSLQVGGSISLYGNSQAGKGENSGTPSTTTWTGPSIVDLNGNGVNMTGKALLLGDEPPDWLVKESGLTFTKVKMKGEGALVYNNYFEDYISGSWRVFIILPPAWVGVVSFDERRSGWIGHQSYALLVHQMSCDAWVVNTSVPAGVTKYRAADYDFIFPPDGFAAGLQESQGWTPYVGQISWTEAQPGSTRYRGCVINVTGDEEEYETMMALVESEEIDLVSGKVTLTLGASPRLSYGNFVDRIRMRGSDNIVQL